MTLDAETVVMGLLGLLCAFLTYWGTRLEARLDRARAELNDLKTSLPVEYVRRADWKERSVELLASVNAVETKLDRLLYRGNHHEER